MATFFPKDFILYDVSHEEVYLTGSWCEWKPNAIKMTKIPNLYFIATVQLPADTKVAYKYIVNGVWMTNPEEDSETDAAGNTNNVFQTPKASDIATSAPSTTAAATSSPSGAKQEIQDAKTSGVATGAAAAATGVAAAAAGTAAAVGLGKSETDGVTGVEKVGPGVTQAVANGSAVSEKDLAKPDLPTETKHKAPLPASTADAPLAPESVRHEEGKGLFSVIGGLGAAAAAAAAKAAHDLEHKIEEKLSGDDHKPALATTAVPEKEKEVSPVTAAGTSSLATTANAGSPVAPSLVASEHKDPAEALQPIATKDGVNRITHDLATVDFEHTKREVVGAVERLGDAIATGLTGFGAAIDGRDMRVDDHFSGKRAHASASSAFGTSLHGNHSAVDHSGAKGVASVEGLTLDKDAPPAKSLPPVTGGPALYPTDGTSAPQEIKINEPKADVSQVQAEASKSGAAAPAQDSHVAGAPTTAAATTNGTASEGKKSGLLEKVKAEIKGDKAPEKPTAASSSTTAAAPATAPAADKKAATSGLGVGQAPTSAAEAPTTPKKGSATTSPNTPSATPADRKRKSSFFHKIKSALSPSK